MKHQALAMNNQFLVAWFQMPTNPSLSVFPYTQTKRVVASQYCARFYKLVCWKHTTAQLNHL